MHDSVCVCEVMMQQAKYSLDVLNAFMKGRTQDTWCISVEAIDVQSH